jgi:uncharacterized protein (DUF433 family)
MNPPLVSRDPEVMSGALCFAGTRVPVKNLFDYLEGTSTLEDFLEDFPTVSRERAVDVLEALRMARRAATSTTPRCARSRACSTATTAPRSIA